MKKNIQKKIDDYIKTAEQENNSESVAEQRCKYQYSNVPVDIVAQDIDEYIIPELQEPCKALWEKNIFTIMCSNQDDKNEAYIMLDFGLSEVNKEILNALKQEKPNNYCVDWYRNNCECIHLNSTSSLSKQEITQQFMKLIDPFVLQDVPRKFYLNKQDYLVKCGCSKEIDNPEYEEISPQPMPIKEENEDNIHFLERLDEWASIPSMIPKTIKVFDENKVKYSMEEYVKKNGDEDKFDKETERVYVSPYFLEKHKNYVSHKNSKQQLSM